MEGDKQVEGEAAKSPIGGVLLTGEVVKMWQAHVQPPYHADGEDGKHRMKVRKQRGIPVGWYITGGNARVFVTYDERWVKRWRGNSTM